MRAGDARMSGRIAVSRGELDQRQRIVERSVCLAGIVDYLDRAVPDRGDGAPVADRHEWRKIELGAMIPAFGDHFRTDPGGIADRNCKWRIRGAWHSRGP